VEKFDPAKDNVLARLGGDEFVFACHCPSEAACLEKMRGLQAAFAKEEIALDGQRLGQLRFSCGVIHYLNNLSNVDQLYQKADQLMYEVKKQGGGNVLLARS
jgi:diguanylate cyclase (GGDEF)-like protein